MPATSHTTHLLYLHGFRSSPQSTKAQQVAHIMATQFPHLTWWCPQLPPSPRAAADLIAAGTADWPTQHMAIIGSSLGGFYATWLGAQRNCKVALLNPAVYPARDLAHYIGEQQSWHDPSASFYFAPAFVDELRSLALDDLPNLDRTWALIAKGDEVLDWQEMTARYQGAQQRLLEGGDHAISDFALHLPALLEFLHLDPGHPCLPRPSMGQ